MDAAAVELQPDDANVVRWNVVDHIRSWRSTGFVICVGSCLNVPQIVAGLVILSLYWNQGVGECDTSLLRAWVVVHIARLTLDYVFRLGAFCDAAERRGLKTVYLVADVVLRYFSFAWLVFGLWWVFLRDSCEHVSPHLYLLTLSLVLINLILWVLPWLVILVLLPFVFCCLPTFTRLLAQLEDGAAQEQIDGLDKVKYHDGMFTPPDEPMCTICLAQYERGEELRILKCHRPHHFHKPCLDQWLRANNSCPLCRRNVFALPDDEENGGDAGNRERSPPPQVAAFPREGVPNAAAAAAVEHEHDMGGDADAGVGMGGGDEKQEARIDILPAAAHADQTNDDVSTPLLEGSGVEGQPAASPDASRSLRERKSH